MGRAVVLAVGVGHIATIFALGISPTLGFYQFAVIVVAELLIWFPDRLGPLSGVRMYDILRRSIPSDRPTAAGLVAIDG